VLKDKLNIILPGDPFVDNGLWILCRIAGKDHPEDLTKPDIIDATNKALILLNYESTLSEELRKVLNMLYTTNYPRTQPSFKSEELQYQAIKNFIDDILLLLDEDPKGETCSVCGIKRNPLNVRTKPGAGNYSQLLATRNFTPMLGSGTMVNFFPNGSEGVFFCSLCLLATQFLPFMVWKSRNLILVHSSDPIIMKTIANMQYHYFLDKASLENFSSNSAKATRTQNAIYSIIVNIIINLEGIVDSPNLVFYSFTNYGQGPDLEGIFTFPNNSFKFLREIHRINAWSEWKKIIFKGFRKENLIPNKKQSTDEVREIALKSKPNNVYSRLFNNKSLVSFFIDYKKRENFGSWNLLKIYLKIMRNFDAKN
jgi:CRISPR-associated protein Cst1